MSNRLKMVMDAISTLISFPVLCFAALVNTFLNLTECVELCTWILKSDYPPVERFRSGVICVVGILCDGLLGNCSDIKDFTTSRKLFITNTSEDLKMDMNRGECEIFEEAPTEEITTDPTAIGRRSTRRRNVPLQAN